jgi:epoxyqueuosine reductase
MLASYRPKEIINPNHPQIAKYAYGLDYHVILKQKMTEVWNELKQFAPELEGRMFTDSAPLYERGYAVNAGLGWLGKNSCLIHPKLGSWVFICEMVINIDLEYDRLFENNHCGKCTRCMDACPTKAIVKPGVIDSRKCIAYLTIEHKGEIQNHLVQKFTNQLFGCDICQDVCPWNQKNQGIELFEEFRLDQELDKSLEEWKRLDQIKFTELYGNSAFSRCGWEGFRRNLKVISDSGKLQN